MRWAARGAPKIPRTRTKIRNITPNVKASRHAESRMRRRASRPPRSRPADDGTVMLPMRRG